MKKFYLSFLYSFLFVTCFSCVTKDNSVIWIEDNVRGNLTYPITFKTENFHKVNDELYRSARVDLDDMEKLKLIGINAILNLENRSEDSDLIKSEKEAAEKYGIKFIRLPMSGFFSPSKEELHKALEIITDTNNQPILVHCALGKDRTGMVIGTYRVKINAWSADKAIEEMNSGTFGSRWMRWWDSVLKDI